MRWSLSMLLLAGGCIEANTDEDSMGISPKPLFFSTFGPPPSGAPALLGSTACFEVQWVRGREPGHWSILSPLEACYDITLSGAPISDGDCTTLDALGELTVDYTPRADCPFSNIDPIADRYRLEVVPIDGLQAALHWHLERAALRWFEPFEPYPPDLIPASPREPLQLVPGVDVLFPIVLLDPEGSHVGWNPTQGRVLESVDGGAPRALVVSEDDLWTLRIEEGSRSTITLALDGQTLDVVEVVATPAERAASIEIVAVANGDSPYAARAMVRDEDGRVIYGAPVQWSIVEGTLAIAPAHEIFAPADYQLLGDACMPPPAAPEARRAVLHAQLGALSDDIELEWTAMPDDEDQDDEPFEPSPYCMGEPDPGEQDALSDRGCGCRDASERGSPGGWWLVPLLLGWGRRRRPPRPRTGPARS